MTAILLAALLASEPRLFVGPGGKPIVPVFMATPPQTQTTLSKRKHTIKATHPNAPLFGQRADVDRDIVCGTVVLKHRTPTTDPRIFLPPRDTGAAVRRIEPDACRTPRTFVTPR